MNYRPHKPSSRCGLHSLAVKFASACLLLTLSFVTWAELETPKKPVPRTLFQFQSFTENEALQQLLQESELASTLEAFIQQNFRHSPTLRFRFADQPDQFNATSRELTVSWHTLHKAYLEILDKHPLQIDVQQTIILKMTEFLIWRETGRFLLSSEGLTISGDETPVLDQFALVALLNQKHLDNTYLLDAVEAYLLATHAMPLLKNDHFRVESEYDEYRYRQMVCLTLGADYEGLESVISDMAWDLPQQEQCQQAYQSALVRWKAALAPLLKKGNQIQSWRQRHSGALR